MENWLEKAKKGSKEDFIKLINPINKELYYIASAKLNNKEDIDDVIQETLLLSYKKIRSVKDEMSFKNWVITILINKCNDLYRKRGYYTFFSYNQNDCDNEYFLVEDYSVINDKIDFDFLLKHLADDEKLIFTLFYSENRTTKEISNLLNINENTIKTKLRRTKDKLKNIIERSIKSGK